MFKQKTKPATCSCLKHTTKCTYKATFAVPWRLHKMPEQNNLEDWGEALNSLFPNDIELCLEYHKLPAAMNAFASGCSHRNGGDIKYFFTGCNSCVQPNLVTYFTHFPDGWLIPTK
jgi:hypothetical protein